MGGETNPRPLYTIKHEKAIIYHAYPTNSNGERTEKHNLYRCNILSNERACC